MDSPRYNCQRGIPDFVLVNSQSGRYVLIVEIKKSIQAVHSLNYQYQAYNYARDNGPRYVPRRPHYTLITNLEETILFAYRTDSSTPLTSRVRNQTYHHGSFYSNDTSEHRNTFINDLSELIQYCLEIGDEEVPDYEVSIPVMFNDLTHHIRSLPAVEVRTTPSRGFFTSEYIENNLLLIVRLLLSQWISHHLEINNHSRANTLSEIRIDDSATSLFTVRRLFQSIDEIDFNTMFCQSIFTSDNFQEESLTVIHQYLTHLNNTQLDQVERLLRNDGFVDYLFNTIQTFVEQRRKGTVQTDYDLARILATLSITNNEEIVFDPCCGVGNLLSAAYDVKSDANISHGDICRSLLGIEIDIFQANLTSLKLAMKCPEQISQDNEPQVCSSNLFDMPDRFREADVILMNPPFKRYEAQDDYSLPDSVKEEMELAFQRNFGELPTTVQGQCNLYHYYVEFAVRCAELGTKFGLILDNKWLHNSYGAPLRDFLLRNCSIDGIIEYPSRSFFEGAIVSTTIVLMTKNDETNENHQVHFIRASRDPRETDVSEIQSLFEGDIDVIPDGWSISSINQSELNPRDGWKPNFAPSSTLSRLESMPLLMDLFDDCRRGSLQKEETASIITFPFRNWTMRGTESSGGVSYQRVNMEGRPYQTGRGDPIPEEILEELTELDECIPEDFRGYAIKSPGKMGNEVSYVLHNGNFNHVYSGGGFQQNDGVIEPPSLRDGVWNRGHGRHQWTNEFEAALDDMRRNPHTRRFMELVEDHLGLNDECLPLSEIWVDLREPAAGELIIPRSQRIGFRVHINPLAFDQRGRQVRISSNLFSLSGLNTGSSSISREIGTRLVAAFLLSSFGQLQFETYCNPREGMMRISKAGHSLESECLDHQRFRLK